ncbi:hypothetical protein ACSBR2_025127 [Camellia fascicularis]
MADDIPHDGAPPEVPILLPAVEVEKSIADEAGKAAEDLAADFEAEAEAEAKVFALGPEPELLPLRVRPFDPAIYHPCMHTMAPGGMMRFNNFVDGVPEDILLREPNFHLSYNATVEDSRSCRGYGAVTTRDWYHELLPLRVHDLVNEAGFGLLCTGLTRYIASRALLGALVERWWDTTNSFHFSSAGEMMMTLYDFSMITGLGVEGDPIPFDMDMGQWKAAWIYLLRASPPLYRLVTVQYSWFLEHFRKSQPETQGEVEQCTQGSLMYLLGTTLFANKWNTVGLYLLRALVTLPWVRFYDWGGAGLTILYSYMSSSYCMKGDSIEGYWRA